MAMLSYSMVVPDDLQGDFHQSDPGHAIDTYGHGGGLDLGLALLAFYRRRAG